MNTPNTRKINIAIDGPASSGKSTVARKVAESLGYIYVDTGAMYRAVALKALREGIDVTDDQQLTSLTEELHIRLAVVDGVQRVYLDGEDVTEQIRSVSVTNMVPSVAVIPGVRTVLVQMQRELAKERGVVMDGRDIGTSVLPDAEVKVFMTASVHIRAERRWKELQGKDPSLTFESLAESIAERDRIDTEREMSPLRQAPGAVLLDTSHMEIDEVIQSVLSLCWRQLEE